MIPDSLQVRRAAVAYLYSGPATPARPENLEFYDAITNSGVELPEMQHQRQELVLLNRPAAGQVFEVRVGAIAPAAAPPPGVFVQQPFRLLVAELGGVRPLKFFVDAADNVYEAFHKVWGAKTGKLQLVEVSLITTVAINHNGGAVGFIRDRLTKTSGELGRHLGRDFENLSIRLSSGPGIALASGGAPAAKLPLSGAQLDLTIEPNLQDASQIAITSTVKWQAVQVRLDQMQVPPELKAVLGGREILELNAEARIPSAYVDEVYGYLEKQVASFLTAVGR